MPQLRTPGRTIGTPDGEPGDVNAGRVAWSLPKTLWLGSMAGVALVGGAATFSWSALALFAAITGMVLLLGHSLGSHRKLIHNSFDCPKWFEYLLVYLGVQVGLAGPIGLLRQHDLRDYAQRQQDCHPYLRHGRSLLGDGWWQLFCELRLDRPPRIDPPAAVTQDRFYRFLERTWMLQQVPAAVLLYLLGGWTFVIWCVCARITAGVTGHWLIGYFAHNHGGMHHTVDGAAVQGRNIAWTSLLTMGESWHNNHHAFPSSARLGLYPGEWDPGWWALVCLRKAGMVTRTALPHELPPRPELRTLGVHTALEKGPALPVAGWAGTLLAARTVLLGRAPMSLRAPGINLAPARLARWCGARVECSATGQARLQLVVGTTVVQGLPGVLLGMAARGPMTGAAALLLLPAAAALESVRAAFEAAQPA